MCADSKRQNPKTLRSMPILAICFLTRSLQSNWIKDVFGDLKDQENIQKVSDPDPEGQKKNN